MTYGKVVQKQALFQGHAGFFKDTYTGHHLNLKTYRRILMKFSRNTTLARTIKGLFHIKPTIGFAPPPSNLLKLGEIVVPCITKISSKNWVARSCGF